MGIFQFVDTISASPDVLLDLHDRNPFFVGLGSSVSPPSLRRSAAQGLGDGTIETGSSYEDRTIKLVLHFMRVDAETQASAIQTLARILDRSDGAWLKFQADGMDEPRFYRTKRADVEVIDDILGAYPERTINLELPAHPFGYGLPETGEFTITNDPTTGENPMMYAWGEILGDVAAPLHLTFPTPDGEHGIAVASQAAFDGTVLTSPYWKSLTAATKNASPPGGSTIVDTADTSMVTGAKRRITTASTAELIRPTSALLLEWDLPAGDYRVFVRAAGVNVGMTFYFWNRPPSTGSTLLVDEAVLTFMCDSDDPGTDWMDMGVAAMPGGAPLSDPAFGLDSADPVPALWNLAVQVPGGSTTVDLDAIMLVPAGRPNTLTTHATAVFPTTFTDQVVTFDGVNNRRYAVGESVNAAGTTTVVAPLSVSGKLPRVVPGASNSLTFFATAAIGGVLDLSDSKTLETVIEFKYFPPYVYERPALT